jgi:hypothetical protein
MEEDVKMHSLITKEDALNQIDVLIDGVNQVGRSLKETANNEVEGYYENQFEQIHVLSSTLQKVDKAINETERSNFFLNMKRSKQLQVKLSF